MVVIRIISLLAKQNEDPFHKGSFNKLIRVRELGYYMVHNDEGMRADGN